MKIAHLLSLLFSLAGVLAAPGCRQPGVMGTAPHTTASAGPAEDRASGARSRYILTRCDYRVAGLWHSVDNYSFAIALMTSPEARELEQLSDEIERLLSKAASRTEVEGDLRDAKRTPCRSYDLSPLDPGSNLAELELLDFPQGGTELEAVARLDEREVRVVRSLPRLSFLLRQGALSVLGTAMGQELYPRRRPLSWHGAALAEFLRKDVLVYPDDWKERALPQERRIVAGVLAELARLRDPAAVSLLVESLVPAAEVLTDADILSLRPDDRIPVRLLSLTREAKRGSKEALQETLALSLEYGGGISAFAAAARSLLPEEENSLLYTRYPPGAGSMEIQFLQEIRRRFASLSYAPGRGWRLAEP